MKRMVILLVLAMLVLGGTVFAEDEKANEKDTSEKTYEKPRIGIGLSVGSYSPTSSTVRDIFGDSLVCISLTPMPTDSSFDMKPTLGASYYQMKRDDSSATLIPITLSMTKGLNGNEKARPYVTVEAGTFYGDVDIPTRNADKKGFGFEASAALGVLFSKRWSLEARYDLLSEFAGLDFSSFTISAVYRVGSLRW